jgi:hypothetical protein
MTVGTAALGVTPSGVPRQGQLDEGAAGDFDPRVLQLMELQERQPGMTGQDAAKELGVPTRTGQRLLQSARHLQEALQLVAQDPSVTQERVAQALGVPDGKAARLHAMAVAELARRAAIGQRRLRSVGQP